MKKINTAVILAAGFGTRLRPLTEKMAKPVMPFFNESLLSHLINQLRKAGITRFFINLHHQGWSVRRCLRSMKFENCEIMFSYESKILGTAGALGPLRKHLASSDFLLVNGDILTDIDFQALIDSHTDQPGAISTLALHPGSIQMGFPAIGSNNSNLLTRFPYGKLKGGSYSWTGTFTGIHVISPAIFDYIESGKFQCINSRIYAEALNDNHSIRTYKHRGYWNDVGTPERYFQAFQDVMTGQCKSDLIHVNNTSIWISPWARIGNSVTTENMVVVHENTRLSGRLHLNNVIVWPNVSISENLNLSNGILTRRYGFIPLSEES